MKQTILRFTALSLLIAASLTIFLDRSHARAARNTNGEALAVAPQGKTVEQTRKNIKVLTGLPEAQLLPVMNFFASALGVRCNHCHVVKDGNLLPELDDKPEKSTAREMIKMVLGVNKTTFGGSTEVSCFTCHRGRTRPVSIPVLPLQMPSPLPSPQSSPAAAGQATPASTPAPVGPTAEQILDKYINAIGGQAAIDKLRTRVVKGTYTGATGALMRYEIYRMAPDKIYQSYDTLQGPIEIGFNGAVGWEKSPRGVREIPSERLADLKPGFQFFHDLKLSEQFIRMSTPRKDKIDGRDVYVIGATRTDGKHEQLFFGVESGLLLRRITYTETMIGVIPDQVDFDHYGEVDGLKVPFATRTSSVNFGNPTIAIKITETKFNVPVDESKFNMPAATKPVNP